MSLLNPNSHDSFTGASPDGGVAGHAQRTASSPTVNPWADEIAVISHELRNSLGVVRNAARLLRSQVDAVRLERARTLIERHVDQMNRHIEQLLIPATLTRRKNALRLTYVDLRTILENAVEAIAADCARKA